MTEINHPAKKGKTMEARNQKAAGTAPAYLGEASPVDVFKQTLELANEVAYRTNRLSSELVGPIPSDVKSNPENAGQDRSPVLVDLRYEAERTHNLMQCAMESLAAIESAMNAGDHSRPTVAG